ncbi:MAG: putative peptide-modifying radical SAM/SPASM domain-containing protein, partial [Thermoplasmata archaeon]
AITTDGRVLACPIAGEFLWNEMGNKIDALHSFKKVEIGEPCTSCDVYDICGGRCLFAYKERLWGDEGFRAVCRVTKHLIHQLEGVKGVVMEKLPQIEGEIDYPPFNNTTEIIP